MHNEIERTLNLVAKRVADGLDRAAATIARRQRSTSRTLNLTARRAEATDLAGRQEIQRAGSALDSTPRRKAVAHPMSKRPRVYEPSAEELAMQRRQLIAPPPGQRPDLPDRNMTMHGTDLDGAHRQKQVWLMRSTDGGRNVFKPFSGEYRVRIGIPDNPGDLARREVAAYRVDRMFGFGRVPPSAIVDGPKGYGRGSIMQFVESGPGRSITKYDRAQQQQMGVLDYVIGNTDRHAGNYRTVGHAGQREIVAIDHGQTFPEAPDPSYGIRSDFVKAHLNQRLDQGVLDAVKAVHPDQLRSGLREVGLSEKAIDGAVARLQEIQMRGKITGEKWPGDINWSSEAPAPFYWQPYRTLPPGANV